MSMYGRTFSGATRGTLPAVREPHSAAMAQASGISRTAGGHEAEGREEQNPRHGASRRPGGQPEEEPGEECEEEQVQRSLPAERMVHAGGNGKTRTARRCRDSPFGCVASEGGAPFVARRPVAAPRLRP